MSGGIPWSSAQEIHADPTLLSVPEVTPGDMLIRPLMLPGISWDDLPTVGGSVVPPLVAIGIVLLAGVVLVAWRAGIIAWVILSAVSSWRNSQPRGGEYLHRVTADRISRRHYNRRWSGSARYSLAFAGLGIASLGGWFVQGGGPSSPLLYFAGVGLFGAVLASLLLSGRTVSPVVAEGLHEALVSTAGRGADDPSGAAVYYPGQDGSDPLSVRVCMLDTEGYDLDAVGDDSSTMAPDGSFRSRPSGAILYRAFRAEAVSEIATDSDTFAWQLCQGLTDWLELVASATLTTKTTDGITIRITGSSVPGVGKFDHPVVSFLGVALACNQERPIVVTAQPSDAGSTGYGISIHPFAGASPQPTEADTPTQNRSYEGNSDDSRRGKARSDRKPNDDARGGTR